MPVTRGITFASEQEALAFGIAANKLVEKGGYDEKQLADLLSQLAASDLGLEGTGFDKDDLDNLIHDLGDDMIEPDGSAPSEELIECPNCHHKFKVKHE